MYIESNPALEKDLNKKIPLAVTFVLICGFFVFFRLWYLQILKGAVYFDLSTNNRIRVTSIPAPRGFIFDRAGAALVENIPSFDLTLTPQDTPDAAGVLQNLSLLLREPIDGLTKNLDQGMGRPPFEPIVLKQNLSWTQMAAITSNRIDLNGVTIDVVPQRKYHLGAGSSHLLGYLGEIGRQELKKDFYSDYARGDLIGKSGIEKWGELYLRGEPGGYQTEVDALGHKKNILAQIDPVSGSDLFLSIDREAQLTAEALLKDKKGAVVALDPWLGDVLVMVSSPGFDPNLFSRSIAAEEWQNLLRSPNNPLMNRALQSQQPPGSVFKIIVALAALEEGLIDPLKEFACPGYFDMGSHVFHCWRKEGHGAVNLRRAIVESCDVYFYQLGNAIGIHNIAKYAALLGLGTKTGIELDEEKRGLLPTPEWKIKRYGTKWQRGETINTAIGQGYVLTTPLQIAAAFCGIANGSFIPKPRLVLKVKEGTETISFPPAKKNLLTVTPQTISFIKDAIAGVVNDPRGTGGRARIDGITVAGKTGTAQVVSLQSSPAPGSAPSATNDHAWFVAMAPVENPRIVVAVFIENGGHGGSAAAPVAKEVIKSFLHLSLLNTDTPPAAPEVLD